ncbi:MAG: hypothetical protein WBR18_15075 [Anaerolineales bacterium]
MSQLHKRFSDQQVAFLLQSYSQGLLSRREIQETLSIGKTRFFELWKLYQAEPEAFAIGYQRSSPGRISADAEAVIELELLRERNLIDDPDLPITSYNYSALRDRLLKQGISVSVNTIIDRAKKLGCHQPRKKHKTHDREVLTGSIGALIQQDGSTHLGSPYATEKWTLITAIDDYSRMLLFADFFSGETTWAHIQATRAVIQTFGIALRWYVDSLRVFRFVQGRDSVWRNHVLQTDDVDSQWGKMMARLHVDVVYALSPQAKGKIERPYRWIQDRVVRTCSLERISSLDEVRQVLHEEVERYNQRQVHSTTKEIPAIRFQRALSNQNSLFRPFSVPAPYTSPDDVFCLQETRVTNGYGRISLFNHQIRVANVPLRQQVDVHLVPDFEGDVMRVRIWHRGELAHTVELPLQHFAVHF